MKVVFCELPLAMGLQTPVMMLNSADAFLQSRICALLIGARQNYWYYLQDCHSNWGSNASSSTLAVQPKFSLIAAAMSDFRCYLVVTFCCLLAYLTNAH